MRMFFQKILIAKHRKFTIFPLDNLRQKLAISLKLAMILLPSSCYLPSAVAPSPVIHLSLPFPPLKPFYIYLLLSF